MSAQNSAQIHLIWIRLRELELAVGRILRLLNELENTRAGLPGIQPITKSTTHSETLPNSVSLLEMGV